MEVALTGQNRLLRLAIKKRLTGGAEICAPIRVEMLVANLPKSREIENVRMGIQNCAIAISPARWLDVRRQ